MVMNFLSIQVVAIEIHGPCALPPKSCKIIDDWHEIESIRKENPMKQHSNMCTIIWFSRHYAHLHRAHSTDMERWIPQKRKNRCVISLVNRVLDGFCTQTIHAIQTVLLIFWRDDVGLCSIAPRIKAFRWCVDSSDIPTVFSSYDIALPPLLSLQLNHTNIDSVGQWKNLREGNVVCFICFLHFMEKGWMRNPILLPWKFHFFFHSKLWMSWHFQIDEVDNSPFFNREILFVNHFLSDANLNELFRLNKEFVSLHDVKRLEIFPKISPKLI